MECILIIILFNSFQVSVKSPVIHAAPIAVAHHAPLAYAHAPVAYAAHATPLSYGHSYYH